MMKIIHSIFLFLISILTYSQIKVTGHIVNDCTMLPIKIIKKDSTIIGTFSDLNGDFELKVKEGGKYTIVFNNIFYSDSFPILLKNDTNLNISLPSHLAYSQPCREILKRNNTILNLPKEKNEYYRIKKETNKLGLKDALYNTDSIFIRLWVEPAFEYLGGQIYEIRYNNKWSFIKYKYQSNYLFLLDSLSNKNIYSDSLFEILLDFKIYSKTYIFIDKLSYYTHRFDENLEFSNYLKKMFKVKDYCEKILINENYTLDGINYHFEEKIGNNYKFISFNNPNEYYKYEQIHLFLKILKYIKKYE